MKNAADDILILFYFSDKIRPGISGELAARQTIHMKCHEFFTLSYFSEKQKTSMLATVLLGVFRVNQAI